MSGTGSGPAGPLWRVRERVCDAGRAVNEDGCGAAGALAWIADGAGAKAPERFQGTGSDAAWLVAEIGRRLHADSGERDMHVLAEDLQAHLASAYGPRSDLDPAGGPTCCLALVRRCPARQLDIAIVGDVVVQVRDAGGVVNTMSDGRVKPFEALSLEMLRTGGRDGDELAAPVREQIQRNRAHMNTAQGFPIVCPASAWAHSLQRHVVACLPGAPVVLMSDGFYRLVDVFERYTDLALYEAASVGRGVQLLAELRALERADGAARAHPRFKIHDDATLLVLEPA